MGNQKSILKETKKINNHSNTEGTQGIMTLTSEKNSKKNTEILYKEKNRNIYSKRESVDILINKNELNTMPTENNEMLKNNINLNKNINNLNKKLEENNIIEQIEKEYKVSQNNSNYNNKIANDIIIQNNNIIAKNNIKKIEFNNITIIDNLSKYFPKNVSKEEIDEIVNIALNGSIVDHTEEYIPGQNLTNEQVNLLKQIIYDTITKKENYYNDYSILDKINVKIGMSELNKQIIEKTFFKGKKISQIQNDIIMKSLTKGRKNVKALIIELL